LRGQTPPAEFYHPAVARRKLRQELRALQEPGKPDGASPAAADPVSDGTDSTATGTAAS